MFLNFLLERTFFVRSKYLNTINNWNTILLWYTSQQFRGYLILYRRSSPAWAKCQKSYLATSRWMTIKSFLTILDFCIWPHTSVQPRWRKCNIPWNYSLYSKRTLRAYIQTLLLRPIFLFMPTAKHLLHWKIWKSHLFYATKGAIKCNNWQTIKSQTDKE